MVSQPEQISKDPPESDEDRRGNKSDSAYRTISEVATDLGLPQHVLRFWETKFKQISPLKRGGGRRYYRPQDIILIKRIHYLLYTQGYTIKGVQKLFAKDKALELSVPALVGDDFTSVAVDQAMQRKDSSETVSKKPVANAEQISPSPISATASTNLQLLLKRLKIMRKNINERC